jgi:hypothetical protein
MYCSECGEFIANTFLGDEASLLAHRLFRHSSPEVQAIASIAFAAVAGWIVTELWKRL